MRYLVDIGHPAHINFFKHALEKLATKGEVYVTYLNRGAVPKIVKREYAKFETFSIGTHRGTKFSIIVEANIVRFFKMLFFILTKKIDIGVNGGFAVGLALRLTGRKYIQFDDDYERRFTVWFERVFADKLFFPMVVPDRPGISKFNALKEWSYLSPKYFYPDINVLSSIGVVAKDYIFIREVSNKTLNYMNQPKAMIASIAADIANLQWKVVLSLEDKKMRQHYPSDWIILEEPVKDIHSIIYYSRLLISSGDSMAREAAMLGVPSIYAGTRQMLANTVLIDEKMLLHINIENVSKIVSNILKEEIVFANQEVFRGYLFGRWDDITEFIVKEITN